jgi:radical SAM superfamily enzyme YgiQ (UPF0313 family)
MTKILFIETLGMSETTLRQQSEMEAITNSIIVGRSPLPEGLLSIQSYVEKQCSDTQIRIVSQNLAFHKRIGTNEEHRQSNLKILLNHFDAFLFNEIDQEIVAFQPDIIGVSVMFDLSSNIFEMICRHLAGIIDKHSMILIAGGHPVSNLHNYFLKRNKNLHAICIGEGEIPFMELVRSRNRIEYLEESPYFTTRSKLSTISFIPKQEYICDLDEIPPYDYETILNTYGKEILSFHSNNFGKTSGYDPSDLSFSFMTTRGCPYHCVFCASQNIHGHAIRAHSIEWVKRSINQVKDKWRISEICFEDDHFLYDVPRAIELIDYISSRGMKVRLPNGLAIAPITQEFVNCLVRNKMQTVYLALESGSNRILKEIIRKPLTLEQVKTALRWFEKTDIKVILFLIAGFPGETLEDIHKSLDFLHEVFYWRISVFTPIPISGSRLWLQLNQDKPVDDNIEIDFEKNTNMVSDLQKQELAVHFPNNDMIYTLNLDLNFVNHPYIRRAKELLKKKEDDEAKNLLNIVSEEFERICKKYPNHAIAHYCLAECKRLLGKDYVKLQQKAIQIFKDDDTWRAYAEYFDFYPVDSN